MERLRIGPAIFCNNYRCAPIRVTANVAILYRPEPPGSGLFTVEVNHLARSIGARDR